MRESFVYAENSLKPIVVSFKNLQFMRRKLLKHENIIESDIVESHLHNVLLHILASVTENDSIVQA